MSTDWLNAPSDLLEHYGFVYKIVHKTTGKYYVGKKFLWSQRVLPPLKGRKNKRHKLVESDWKDYWGSSKKLLADIEKFGKDNFTREILKVGDTKFECAYFELLEQLDNDVLFDKTSYNEIISVRLRRVEK